MATWSVAPHCRSSSRSFSGPRYRLFELHLFLASPLDDFCLAGAFWRESFSSGLRLSGSNSTKIVLLKIQILNHELASPDYQPSGNHIGSSIGVLETQWTSKHFEQSLPGSRTHTESSHCAQNFVKFPACFCKTMASLKLEFSGWLIGCLTFNKPGCSHLNLFWSSALCDAFRLASRGSK